MDASPTPGHPRIVVTIHGIRTYRSWSDRLAKLLGERDPVLLVEAYGYGYFSSLALLIPLFRWIEIWRFGRALRQLKGRYTQGRIDIVAHSFGTYIVAHAIKRTPREALPEIGTVIVAGSVLRSQVRRVSNDTEVYGASYVGAASNLAFGTGAVVAIAADSLQIVDLASQRIVAERELREPAAGVIFGPDDNAVYFTAGNQLHAWYWNPDSNLRDACSMMSSDDGACAVGKRTSHLFLRQGNDKAIE